MTSELGHDDSTTPTAPELIVSPLRRHRRAVRRQKIRLAIILLSACILAIGYPVIMAAWQSADEPFVSFLDLLVPRFADVLIAAWAFFIGSSIGSFLNVVAWRMPRGVSINGRSHCPRCDTTLTWSDNWPVFGWIVLGGRCRTCRLPISPRYPIVEAAVGVCVMSIALVGVFSDASHLPFWPKRFGYTTALWLPYLSNDSLGLIAYHSAGVACLWALALVRVDENRLPRMLIACCLGIVVVPMLAVPFLAVVPWTVSETATWVSSGNYLNAVMRVLTGAAMAVMLARMLARHLCPAADPKLNPLGEPTTRLIDLAMMLSLMAILVGWQAALGVTVVAVFAGSLVSAWLIRNDDPLAKFAIGLPIATTIHLVCWGTLHNQPWWPSVNTTPAITLLWAAAVLIVPRALVIAPHDKATEHGPDPVESD